VCELLKTGQPLSWNLVLYALVSAIGGYLAKTAIPGAPAATAKELAPAEEGESK
jgi:hypothetical protein